MAKIRVLIVDDSVLARKMISDALVDPDLEIVGTATDGRIALTKVPLLKPNIVISDVEMPELDGMGFVKEMHSKYPDIKVILFSGASSSAATRTSEALRLGACDFVIKPSSQLDAASTVAAIRAELVPRIKHLCPETKPAICAVPTATKAPVVSRPTGHVKRIDAIVIGISTGGPNALMEVIPRLPADFPVPILIVQHMPATFTRLLAERLTASGQIPVAEAVANQAITPGRIWIAPGDFHLTVRRRDPNVVLYLDQNPMENSCRPAVDPLFRSAAEAWGNRVLGVIMTGMGQDGLLGAQALAKIGASVIAQDEASSVVWGMPGAVAKAGLAERLIPLQDMANELHRRACDGRPGLSSIVKK